MVYQQITFSAQKVSICNRYIRLFQDEHNSHPDGTTARALRVELNHMIPSKYHGYRTIYLSVIWNKVLSDIPEVDRPIADAKFKETLQQVRKFAKWQRNHFKPTIRRIMRERQAAREGARQDSEHNPTLSDFTLVNGKRRMNRPSKNPNVNEATNFAFAERFLHLHPEAAEEYREAAEEVIAEAKHQAYESSHWDSELDLDALRLHIDMPEPPDPLEDLTTYIEVDPNGRLVVDSAKVVATALSRNEDAYVYKDFGIDHFDGDFSHLARFKPVTSSDTGAVIFPYLLANTVDDAFGIQSGGGSYLGCFFISAASITQLRLRESDSGTTYDDISAGLSLGTNYWPDYSRDEAVGTYGTFYGDIYDDIDYTSLFDALSVTLHTNKKDYRYAYAINTFNTGAVAADSIESGDFDLQEIANIVILRRRMEDY